MREVSKKCVEALLNATADASVEVREQLTISLRAMAAKDLSGVLTACQQWLAVNRPNSTTQQQRFHVVRSMSEIVKAHATVSNISNELRDKLIACSISEMTAVNEINSIWSKESCNFCVELCDLFPRQGCAALLEPILPNTLPHFFIIQALCNFAEMSPLRFVPFLKEVMAKILPILGLAKQDNHRMVFSNALGAFSDAILQINSRNEELTPRSVESASLSVADFADTMHAALTFLGGEWSRVSELRVRGPVMFALGTTSAVISDENRVLQLPKVVLLLLNGLKREKANQQAFVSRGMAACVSRFSDTVGQAFLPLLEQFLTGLLNALVVSMIDLEPEREVKTNLGYLLLAFENIAEFNLDGLITFISKMLDAKTGSRDPGVRAACLNVFRHIISRKNLEPRADPFKDNIIATIKLCMQDADWRVKKGVCNCVVSMGASGLPFFTAIGGPDMLSYLIRYASISDGTIRDFNEKKKQVGAVSPEDIRDMCRNTLTVFTASQSRLDASLWPFIFEHFNEHVQQPALLNSFPTICRCIVQLGNRAAQGENFYVDFTVSMNVPKPGHLATKFLVQAMQFSHYTLDELNGILEAMSVIGPLIDDPFSSTQEEVQTPVGSLWLSTIPELQQILLSGTNVEDWEEVMSKLVSKTITAKQNEAWVEEMTLAAMNHIPAYINNPFMMRSVLLVIGIGIGRCTRREFVAQGLDAILEQSNHDNFEHRMGIAKAFGYITAHHPDAALERLGMLAKGPEKKGFFGSKDKTKKELVEMSRAVAAGGLCYGARKMPQGILTSRLEASIAPLLISIMNETKNVEVKEAVFEFSVLLEPALKKQPPTYMFKCRDTLIETIIGQVPIAPNPKIPSGKTLMTSAFLAMRAVTSLTVCTSNPPLSNGTREKLLVFLLQFLQRSWIEIPANIEESAVTAATQLITAFFNNMAKFDLDILLKPLYPLTIMPNGPDRHRSLTVFVASLRAAVTRMNESLSAGEEVSGALTVGVILGRLVPRFLDTESLIRGTAGEGIVYCLRLVQMFHAPMCEEHEVDIDAAATEIKSLRARAMAVVKDNTASSEKEIAAITKMLCAQIVMTIPDPTHFTPLLDTLLQAGLTDPQADAASCSCVVMHGMIRGLGGRLSEEAAQKNLETLVEAVEKVGAREQSLNGILVSIRNLTKHHNILSFNRLLKYPAPHTPNVALALQSIASDRNLATQFIHHCLDTVLNSQLVEEAPDKDKKKTTKVLAPVPLSAACVFGCVCQTPKGIEVCLECRADVLGALFLYLSTAHDHSTAEKIFLVAKSLQQVVSAVCEELTVDRMERFGWALLLSPDNFLFAVAELIKYLSREELGDTRDMDRELTLDATQGLPLDPSSPTTIVIELAQFILPYVNKPVRSHRRAAIAVCSILLRCSLGEKKLLQSLVTALLSRSGADEDPVIRSEALLGFANLTIHPYDDIISYVSPALSALLSNFGDNFLQVSLAAMLTLRHIVEELTDKGQVSPIVVNIILKVKTLFEVAEPKIRAQAYEVLGLMVKLANDGLMDEQTIEQQLHLHLVTLLVHVEDPDDEVRQAVKSALQQVVKFMCTHSKDAGAASRLEELFGRSHMQPASKTRYDEFANDFCYLWVLDFSGRVNDLLVSSMTFFGSPIETLRGAAVTLCGFVLKHLPPQDFGRANVDQICVALTTVLNENREGSAIVRAKAARSLGLMREI